jgi:hypothetical protein
MTILFFLTNFYAFPGEHNMANHRLKHLSFIEREAQSFTVPKSKTKGSKLHPTGEKFSKPESEKTLFRTWQKNPSEGEVCWTITNHGSVEKIFCEPKFRIFFQAYRAFNIFLTMQDACGVRDELLEFMEKKQYDLYGITKQLNLFEEGAEQG